MTRCCAAVVCFAALLWPMHADAQHFHHHYHTFSVQTFGGPFAYYSSYGFVPYAPAPMPVVAYAPPPQLNGFAPMVMPAVKSTPKPSSPAAIQKSLEQQTRGDQRLREQKWSEARVAYVTAVSSAPDRAEAHFRLALCFVTIAQYESAINQIKLALKLDPMIGKTSKTLVDLLGPNSTIVRNSILTKLSDWVSEDAHNSDRLFLLGVVLQSNGDSRAQKAFDLAIKTNIKGDVGHITQFAKSTPNSLAKGPVPNPDGLDQSNQPLALEAAPGLPFDLRFSKSPSPVVKPSPMMTPVTTPLPGAPIPMPDGPGPTL